MSKEFKNALIAVGGRPSPMNFNGAHHMLTSDDIFFLKQLPKKVVIVGGGYIAHECASYLRNLGTKVAMITRGRFLRTFDRQTSSKLKIRMEDEGVTFFEDSAPMDLIKTGATYTITFNQKTPKGDHAVTIKGLDFVMSAVSRDSNCPQLNLSKAFKDAIKLTAKGKVIGGHQGEAERLGPNVYAVGDCLEGVPELTPVAIRGGKEVAQRVKDRLKQIEKSYPSLNYKLFPSTMFTSPEYSYCGYTEEEAIKEYGEEKVVCYHRESPILELALTQDSKPSYYKIVCLKGPQEKIIGMHFLGPNAGEVMQGFYVAMELGLTKTQLDRMFGIHPTTAEDFIGLNKTSDDNDMGKTAC